jgi:PmbA protein
MAMEQEARKVDPRVTITESCAYQDAFYEVTLVNSLGLEASYRGAYCGLYSFLVAEEGGDNQTGFSLQFRLKFSDLDPYLVGREAAEKAARMLGAKCIPTQKGAVVLDPYVVTNFLGVMAPALAADAVQKGKSLFAGKKEEKVASSLVSLIDDGALSDGVLSSPFDGEGVATGRKVLVQDGILQGYLYDVYTAAKDGMASTGNGLRGSYRTVPEVGPSNLFIPRGNTSREQLIGEIDRGLYITEVMGIHTANPISGDFSVGAAGILIENGKLTTPVRGVAIAGNMAGLLQDIDCVGDDLTFFLGKGSPTLRIQQMTISGC